jgi:methionyl-tRNA synthetase
MQMQKCQDCGQYYPAYFIVSHKEYCTKPKSFQNCSFCKMVVDKKSIENHEKNCEKNPEWIPFIESKPERNFEKVKIKHTPFPTKKINPKK